MKIQLIPLLLSPLVVQQVTAIVEEQEGHHAAGSYLRSLFASTLVATRSSFDDYHEDVDHDILAGQQKQDEESKIKMHLFQDFSDHDASGSTDFLLGDDEEEDQEGDYMIAHHEEDHRRERLLKKRKNKITTVQAPSGNIVVVKAGKRRTRALKKRKNKVTTVQAPSGNIVVVKAGKRRTRALKKRKNKITTVQAPSGNIVVVKAGKRRTRRALQQGEEDE